MRHGTLRRILSRGVLIVLLLCSAPAFAAEGCRRCAAYSSGTTVAVFCQEVGLDQMGNMKCAIRCFVDESDVAICECTEEGDWCMVIVVEG